MTLHAYIPSPSQGVWHVGPVPLRAYAFFIIIGIVVAVIMADRRWRARGGDPATVNQIATWAVPFGLIGGRLYHVITDPELYFKRGDDWVHIFYVWSGGLGIWGAIALGALGAYIGCKRAGASFPAFADAAAPGIVLAQAIGRWGNYFNQELFGKSTTMPWGLKIDADHAANVGLPAGVYQPTFLYESLWDVGAAVAVLWADKRYRMGHGRAFLLYVMIYVAGRSWIEYLRVDTANHILGLRLNLWTCMLVFALALITFIVSLRRSPGREAVVELRRERERLAAAEAGSASAASSAGSAAASSAGSAAASLAGSSESDDAEVALARAPGAPAPPDQPATDESPDRVPPERRTT